MIKNLFILLWVLLGCSLEMSPQQPSTYAVFALVNYNQDKIDLIHQGMNDALEYFEFDTLEEEAKKNPDPQSFLDLILWRYHRVMSKLNFASARVALENADILSNAQVGNDVEPIVMEQGIAKYTDMTNFFIDNALIYEEQYEKEFGGLLIIYGELLSLLIQLDNDFLSNYGVSPEPPFILE
ncbi:MAG: hypothetical protein HDR95_01020 [Bacteroides sp.]|nr:hypothetical protein [Bacteroidales bacterium]MBD5335881.1 hypothetical protein [Bacteroides sp.]